MKFESLKEKDLVEALNDIYSFNGFTHVNLTRYEPIADSFGDEGKGLPPLMVPLNDFNRHLVDCLNVGGLAVGINSNARLATSFQEYMPQLEIDYKHGNLEEATYETERILDLFPKHQTVLEVETDHGYHYHGTKAMSLKNWKKFMYSTREGFNEVDQKFVKASLGRGYSTLRITGSEAKPLEPKIALVLDTSKSLIFN